jgi:hypothetical protein
MNHAINIEPKAHRAQIKAEKGRDGRLIESNRDREGADEVAAEPILVSAYAPQLALLACVQAFLAPAREVTVSA